LGRNRVLEPDEGKLSRPVLRELEASNGLRLLGIVWLRHLLGCLVSAFGSNPALQRDSSSRGGLVALQLRQTWEEGEEPQRLLLFDRDSKFAVDVASTVEAMGCQPRRTAFRSPWQEGLNSYCTS